MEATCHWCAVATLFAAGWRQAAGERLLKLCELEGVEAARRGRRRWEAADLGEAAVFDALLWLEKERVEHPWQELAEERGHWGAAEFMFERSKELHRVAKRAAWRTASKDRRRSRSVLAWSELLLSRKPEEPWVPVAARRRTELLAIAREALFQMKTKGTKCYAPEYGSMLERMWLADEEPPESKDTRKRMNRALRKALICAAEAVMEMNAETSVTCLALIDGLTAKGDNGGTKHLKPVVEAIQAFLQDLSSREDEQRLEDGWDHGSLLAPA